MQPSSSQKKNNSQASGVLPKPPFNESDIENTTPMMAQFMETKLNYQDCLLFYRMGDFYELFFNDAVIASRELDITLTKRGTHNDEPIAMCGVPFHAYENYLNRLINKGYKVAICEQVETPDEAKARAKKEGGKALVKRDVVRIVTQGTLTEDSQLDTKANNFLMCLNKIGLNCAGAIVDISTGLFIVESCFEKELPTLIERYRPSEILISSKLEDSNYLQHIFIEKRKDLTIWSDSRFDVDNGNNRLCRYYDVKGLDAFGEFSDAMIAVSGALLDYIELTQKGKIPYLQAPSVTSNASILHIDASTRKNLELNRTLSGERKGSLLHTIDETVTAAGGRLIAHWLNNPLYNLNEINNRFDCIDFFKNNDTKTNAVREVLKTAPDLERSLSRLNLDRGGPRDLHAILKSIQTTLETKDLIESSSDAQMIDPSIPSRLQSILSHIIVNESLDKFITKLNTGLKGDLPLLSRDGGFVKAGYDPKLDELLKLKNDSRQIMLDLETKYLELAGVTSLKIKHNNVIGYYIEVPSAQGQKLFDDETKTFIHRQTMANAVRFTTVELTELEQKISSASDKILGLELQIYSKWVDLVKELTPTLSEFAKAMAHFDVFSSIALLSQNRNYIRPILTDDKKFDIVAGRHPVVENFIEGDKDFIPNNCSFDENTDRIWLLTGPNMAGKSTFLRQNALLVIMAQAGFFIPAEHAEIGLVDKIFSRVGAADDLARGHSTFMVEMVETATILNQATDKSLVILDEIGRGTSTFDGLSIAWACLEYLHNTNQCRSLFATHYHELTALKESLNALSCHTIKIKEWHGDVIFMHEVIDGEANRSYGIHVAKLAGLPKAVINRSKTILKNLENQESLTNKKAINTNALPLFDQAKDQDDKDDSLIDDDHSELLTAIDDLSPDQLTPREALQILYDLKDLKGKS